MKTNLVFAAMVVLLAVAPRAKAQGFFGPGTAYGPEISTVQSGALLDAQVVVSSDRKYVTINMRTDNSRLIALHTFQVSEGTFGTGGGGGGTGGGGGAGGGGGTAGFVGGANPTGSTGNPNGNVPTAGPGSSSPADIQRRATAATSVLSRQGMYLLAQKK